MTDETTPRDPIALLTAWGRERAKKCETQKAVSDAHAEYASVKGQMQPRESADAAYSAWVAAGNANLRQHDRVAALYSELCAIADDFAKETA